jgi:hypothetical protein
VKVVGIWPVYHREKKKTKKFKAKIIGKKDKRTIYMRCPLPVRGFGLILGLEISVIETRSQGSAACSKKLIKCCIVSSCMCTQYIKKTIDNLHIATLQIVCKIS